MGKLFVIRIGLAVVLSAGVLFAADRKIVINAVDDHNRWAFTEEALREYRNAGQDAAIVLARSPAEVAREIVDADAVIGGISKDLFPAAKKLKWVQTYSAGVEAYRWEEFLESSVVLTNCKIVQGPNIADHAMAMLLALTRGLNAFFADKGKEESNREGNELLELQDMTAVVIGVGGIGSQIAQRAHGFGMKVIGVDPKDLPPNITVSRMVYPSQLDSVLPLADVVFVSAPLTPESRGTPPSAVPSSARVC
jgi:phosphoglycerate dehydrogenase-like enzyme